MQQLEFFEAIDKPTSVCPVCEKIFEKSKTNSHRKYCSNKCNQKTYRQKNKEKILESEKLYRQKNKEKISEYYQKNKENISQVRKLFYQKNKEKRLETCKLFYQKNKEKILESHKLYFQKNKERINIQNKRKYYNDIQFKLRRLLSHRVRNVLKNQNILKKTKTIKLTGCSWQEARDHLQSQFKEGMTWENHGPHGWHIDHIIPCSSFDLTDPEQQKKCFHYTNIQPLWWHENLSKGCKILS